MTMGLFGRKDPNGKSRTDKSARDPNGRSVSDSARKGKAQSDKAQGSSKKVKSPGSSRPKASPSKPKRTSVQVTTNKKVEPLLAGGESTERRSSANSEQPTEYKARVYEPPALQDKDSSDDDTRADRYLAYDEHEDIEEGASSSRVDTNDTSTKAGAAKTMLPPSLHPNVSEMTSHTFESESAPADMSYPSQSASRKSGKTHGLPSGLTTESGGAGYLGHHGEGVWSEDSYIVLKQKVAYLSITISAVQLGVLLIQIVLCGLASVDVNYLIGPYPDAFSEWGGKNAYLMLEEKQYFRLITPVLLHVGLLHFLVNAFCQLETCALFEREWGSFKWLVLYLLSGVGSVVTSCAESPDLIGVCSSGAIMGLFGAKFAQMVTWTTFDLRNSSFLESIHLDQLGGVLCSAAIVALLSACSYIDWSGQIGGLLFGFLGGMILFCGPIESEFLKFLWAVSGLAGLGAAGWFIGNTLLFDIAPDEDLGDACQYFINLYPEGYDCECAWS